MPLTDFKYKVDVACDWVAAQDWCVEHIGQFGVDWYKFGIDIAPTVSRGPNGEITTTWVFKDEAMMTMFLLKWGNNNVNNSPC